MGAVEMQYAMLGSTGLVVSRMAFGAMTFTQGNKDIGAIYKVGRGSPTSSSEARSRPASTTTMTFGNAAIRQPRKKEGARTDFRPGRDLLTPQAYPARKEVRP
jgi:hypothetical protein